MHCVTDLNIILFILNKMVFGFVIAGISALCNILYFSYIYTRYNDIWIHWVEDFFEGCDSNIMVIRDFVIRITEKEYNIEKDFNDFSVEI